MLVKCLCPLLDQHQPGAHDGDECLAYEDAGAFGLRGDVGGNDVYLSIREQHRAYGYGDRHHGYDDVHADLIDGCGHVHVFRLPATRFRLP